MRTVTLYKYERPNGGLTVTPVKPDTTDYTVGYRLIADEGKAITDGTRTAICVDVESTDGWSDCELPEETNVED